jgi:hypothetical protein
LTVSGRRLSWLLVLLIAAAFVVTVPALAGASGAVAWALWLSLALNLVAVVFAGASLGVPAGATRDFLTWLALGTWLVWAMWWAGLARWR